MKKLLLIILIVLSFLSLLGCNNESVTEKEFDVIVIGTDPEGIAAAISTARNGLKTLLIDHRDSVGGLFTQGWLNFLDMNYDHEGTLLTQGIFLDFFNQIEGVAFDIQTARSVFNEMIAQEDNIELVLNAQEITPVMHERKAVAISARVNDTSYNYSARYFIDATQDGDIVALAGGQYTLGQISIGGPEYGMAVTQVFKIGGVQEEDWREIRRYLNNDGDVNSGSTYNTAWGFPELYHVYQAKNENVQMRGLNIARQSDGCIMINALQIFAINPLVPAELEKAQAIALDELEYIIPFLREYIPGMNKIELLSVAPELYVRESRHFITEYIVTIDDVMEHRDFISKIALGSYPVDLQGTAPGEDVIILGNPALYSIPLEATVPKGLDNIFIVSRSAGYDALAHGSTRVVPIGMSVAEGVGQAVYLIDREGITIRDLILSNELISQLQDDLTEHGAYLPEINYPAKIASHKYYNGVKLLWKYGLIQGRYDNNFRLEDTISLSKFKTVFDHLKMMEGWEIELIAEELNIVSINNLSKSLASLNTKDFIEDSVLGDIDPLKPLNRGEAAMFFYLLNDTLASLTR